MNLLDLLDPIPGLQQAVAGTGNAALSGAPSPTWAVLAAYLQRHCGRTVVLVTPTGELATQVAGDLQALPPPDGAEPVEVLLFPVPEHATPEEIGGDSSATRDRLATLEALHGSKPVLVVSTVNALAHPTLPPDELRHGYDEIVVRQTLDRDLFVEHLTETGYERVEQVEAPGQFAVRGGLVDFYPPAGGTPWRIELWGDEVDSIRNFDTDTQRSTQKHESVKLTPPREVFFTPSRGAQVADQLEVLLQAELEELRAGGREDDAEALHEAVQKDIERLRQGVYFHGLERYRILLYPERPLLLDHLPPDAVVVWADPKRCDAHLDRMLSEDEAMREAAAEDAMMVRLGEAPLCDFASLRQRGAGFRTVDLYVSPGGDIMPGQEYGVEAELDFHLPPVFSGKLDQFLDWLKSWQNKGGLMVISTLHARRVREILADGNVHHVHLLDAVTEPQPGLVLLLPHRLTNGFFLPVQNAPSGTSPTKPGAPPTLCVLTDAEMFGWQTVQRPIFKGKAKKRGPAKAVSKGSPLSQLADLKAGDFVVHINHGIARYAGVVQRDIAGAVNEYLLLEYAGTDRLYVPVGQLDRVQKYLGADAVAPPLNQLKGNAWERTKSRVREETMAAAKQLAELYAAREQATKEPLGTDTPWQREMESAFPFEETPSQLTAIKETKADQESPKPMDRLVCGDVGYGKTEVAVRAAFKAVQDGRQVAVLVPTTILAQQHYQTFSERLAPYPIRVEVLSRFRTPAEMKSIAEDLKQGGVDILIGTHRLLQKDVHFARLGLVVVDEEQRFGVMQKEKFKEMRREVDVLTLSATPIPRTMQFALGGLREISLITDPPQGRLPVRTFVMPHRDEVVRQAVERELEREGQVYYVHNRIGSIAHLAERLHQLVPSARIGVGHGQMADEDLEQVMLDFMHHRTDVLLSTTIIENGLDLPNVNTLIVDRSELLGLSQMYQLRGRVGRSSRQAYAYFFSGARGRLSEATESRLAALQEFTDLGAGFKIAMRDLEIRGAGDLMGLKQSGTIAAVGFEMYTDMLSEAVHRIRRQPVERREELPEVDLPIPAFLPPDYVQQERDRLALYRKMAGVTSAEDVAAVQEELRDRFGPLPVAAFNMMRILRLRVHLRLAHLRGISKSESEVLIRLKPGDRFADEDTAAVYAELRKNHDKRAMQHVSLRPMHGLAVDSRILTQAQLLKMVEQICEVLGIVRGARFLGGGS